jgi:hypothetical protein
MFQDYPVDAEAKRFARDGYLSIPALGGPGCVAQLGAIYEQFLGGKVACGPFDRRLGDKMRQIMEPCRLHPAFADNEAVQNGRRLAQALLKVENPKLAYSMLIYKEPGQVNETPWHQDFAYAEMPFTPAGRDIPPDQSIQFWMALDDVDEANGCMHFLPGCQRDALHPHFVAGGRPRDDGRLLAIENPDRTLDLSRAVACPLKAGGATAHGLGTPHYTSGNRTTDRPRRAFIFNFARRGLDGLLQS